MSGSMWCCSGRHWFRSSVAWTLFGCAVWLGLDPGAGPVAAGNTGTVLPAFTFQFAAPVVAGHAQVTIGVRALDLATLDAAAFGDHDAPGNEPSSHHFLQAGMD